MMGSPPELGTKYMHCCHWSVVSDCLQPHGLQPARLLHPRDSPGKKTGVGCHFLVQGIFPTQGSNAGLLPRRQILSWLSHQGTCKISHLFFYSLNGPGHFTTI